jgi:hypothetical protein
MRQHFAAAWDLLCPEGLAVGALVLGGVCFMGAHQDAVQGAVVLGIAVVSAGLDGAFNALVGMTVHRKPSFLFDTALVWTKPGNPFRKNLLILHFFAVCAMIIAVKQKNYVREGTNHENYSC